MKTAKNLRSRMLCMLVLTIVVTHNAFADPLFGFQLSPVSPLHRPYLADPFNTDFALNYVMLDSAESRPAYLYKVKDVDGAVTYEGYDIDQYYSKGTTMLQMRAGTAIPFARISFNGTRVLPSLEVEAVMRGSFRSMFFAYSGTDNLGFDGTYSYGASAKVGSFLTLFYGRKHHSGHMGDEILMKVEERVAHTGPSLFENTLIDYVRQDPITYAVSLSPMQNIRLYGELRIGDTGRILKPRFSSPDAIEDGYRGREIEVGTELSFPIPLLGDFSLAFDMIFHEVGKFVPVGSGALKNGEYQNYSFVYDKEAPWETEIQIVVSQALSRRTDGMKARLMATYHKGRFPLFAFHMSKGSYLAVGASFSF